MALPPAAPLPDKPATAVAAHPAVAIWAEASLKSADVQESAAVLLSVAAVVLFCVNTGLHLAPMTLSKGAICRQTQTLSVYPPRKGDLLLSACPDASPGHNVCGN